jgi:ketosteroid isomerase-like protein
VRSSHVAWSARDWDAYADHYAASFRFVDGKSVAHAEVGRDDFLASMQAPFGFDERAVTVDVLATRGERLVLTRETFCGSTHLVGESETSQLELTEIDDDGRFRLAMWFDPHDVGAAYDELAARYAAGEGAAFAGVVAWEVAMHHAVQDRDWERFEALFTSDFEAVDHRPMGWGALRGADYFASVRRLVELAPDACLWTDHAVAMAPDKALTVNRNAGTRDGAPFENIVLIVTEFAEDGRCARWDLYAVAELEAARQRYDDIHAEPQFENLATRHGAALRAAWNARDWNGVLATLAPSQRQSDQRSHAQLVLDSSDRLADMRTQFDLGLVNTSFTLLATRGERLALYRTALATPSGDIEFPYLSILAVDADGLEVDSAIFDADDVDGAFAALDDMFARGEAAPFAERWTNIRRFARRYGRIDVEEHARGIADDYVLVDHRPLGWGRLDKAGYLEQLWIINDLSPDAVSRIDHVPGLCGRATFVVTTTIGTAGSGDYEIPVASIAEYDDDGYLARSDYYVLDQLDEARARYHELAVVPPNRATRVVARHDAAFAARDHEGVEACLAPNMTYEDRRGHVRLTGDRGAFLASSRFTGASPTFRMERTLLATAGDRAALFHLRGSGGPAGSSYDSELLTLFEVTANDQVCAFIAFAADDLAEARAELSRRAGAGDTPAPNAATRAFAITTGFFNAREVERYREACSPEVVFEDRQHHLVLGIEAWIEDARFVTTGVSDVQMVTELVATAGDRLAVVRVTFEGSVSAGGPFRAEFLQVLETDAGGLLTAVVKYEPDDRVGAFGELHGRFAEGEAAPYPEATTLLRALTLAVLTNDWVAWRAMLADDFTLHDRRAAGLGTLDGPDWVEAQRVMTELSPDVVSTATEVVAIDHHGWIIRVRIAGTLADGGPFENDHLDLFTVAGDRITHVELFDPHEVETARARLEELRPGPAPERNAAVEATRRHDEAFARRDWEAVRANCSQAMVYEDHRSFTRDVGDVDGFLDSVRYIASRPGIRLDRDLLATCGDRLALDFMRWGDNNAEADRGMVVEVLSIVEVDDAGRVQRIDTFDPDDRRAAFAELERRFVAGEAAPSAAGQAPILAFDAAFAGRDWPALRDALADDFVSTDHRTGWMGTSGRADYVSSMRIFTELSPDVVSETVQILAWADHGRVARTKVLGTQRDAGPFENEIVWMLVTGAGRIRQIEVWSADEVTVALAAFAQARPGS